MCLRVLSSAPAQVHIYHNIIRFFQIYENSLLCGIWFTLIFVYGIFSLITHLRLLVISNLLARGRSRIMIKTDCSLIFSKI